MEANQLNKNDSNNEDRNSEDRSEDIFFGGEKNIFSKYKKFIVTGAMLALLAVVIAGTRAASNDGGVSDSYGKNIDEETEEFEIDAYPQVNALFEEYYSYYASGDTDSIEKIAYPITKTEKSYIELYSKYVDSYENIKCYTKKGVAADEFIAAVVVDTKFKDIRTGAPGVGNFYVRKDEDGTYYIDNAYSQFNQSRQEIKTEEKIDTLITEFAQAQDAADLEKQVHSDYEKALSSDADLDQMVTGTVQNAISEWVASFGSQSSDDSQGGQDGTAARTGHTTTRVNMRAKRNVDSEVLQTLKAGRKVTVYGESKKGWLKVKANGKTGFIKEEYIVIDETKTENKGGDNTKPADGDSENDKETKRAAHTTTRVNMREKRDVDSNIVQTLKAGRKVTVYGESSSGWLKVKANGKTGFIKEEYIEFDEAGPDEENTPEPENDGDGSANEQKRTGHTTTRVNMREKRSTDSDVVQTLKAGRKVTVYGESSSGWLKIKANGKNGFIKEEYIEFEEDGQESTPEPDEKEEEPSADETTRTAYTKTEVNLRKQKSTDSKVLRTLDAGTKVTVYGKSEDGWFKVKAGGKTGYIKKEYIVSDKSKVESGDDSDSPSYYNEGDTIRLTQSVNIRSGMSENADIITLAYEGDVVTVIMSYAEGWTRVSYDGETGYVKTEVLK